MLYGTISFHSSMSINKIMDHKRYNLVKNNALPVLMVLQYTPTLN
jgi:hypothetical protein